MNVPDTTELPPGSPAQVVRSRMSDTTDKEICLFVAYSPDGKTGTGLDYFLNAFVAQGISVAICLITEMDIASLPENQLIRCDVVMVRRNAGYDFGAWAGTLRAMPDLWNAKRLYFVNDSILGPNENFGPMIERIRNSDEDFIALTANWIDVYHAQSYFFVYQNDALKNPEIKEYWSCLPDFPSKVDVIRNSEQYQLDLFERANLSSKIVFSMSRVLAQLSKKKRQKFNPTHDAWRNLLNEGFPFIKADLFYRSNQDLNGWGEYFQTSAVLEQIREILKSRLFESSSNVRNNHSSLFVIKLMIGEARFFELRRKWKGWKTMRKAREMYSTGCKQVSSREAGVRR